jgi:hypothetical protein
MKQTENILSKKALLVEAGQAFLVLAFASVLPILFHLIPYQGAIPIGARFLPIFYAPIIGIMLFRPRVGIFAGILAPVVNAAITGRPDAQITLMLTVDLAIFTVVLSLLFGKIKYFWANAAISYIIAKFTSIIILGIIPGFMVGDGRIACFLNSLWVAEPAIVMFLLINFILAKYLKRNK